MASRRCNLTFRRCLTASQQEERSKLNDILIATGLNNDKDTPVWSREKSRKFTVKSMYNSLFENNGDDPNTEIWKAKMPLKIKIFMWLAKQDVILTKDNLLRKKWKGDPNCAFCSEKETIDHLFFGCNVSKYVWSIIAVTVGANCRPESIDQYMSWIKQYLPNGMKFHFVGLAAIIWATWKLRNRMCFEKKLIQSPTEIEVV